MKESSIYRIVIGVLLVIIVAVSVIFIPKTAAVPTTTAPATADFRSYQDGLPFRWIGTNQEVPVVKIMMAGFLQACTDYGLDCQLMAVSGNDIAKSVEMAEQSVSLGSSGIVSTIYDKAWYAPTSKAIAAGIPVINGHFPMASTLIPGLKAWVAPNNVSYAYTAAEAMAKKIDCNKGKVAITQSTLSDGENAVADAFRSRMKDICPMVKVLPVQIETTDPAQAIAVTSAIIQANPDLTGAFSTTGGGATAWATSAKENGLAAGALTIIGMDASRPNLDLLKSGEVYALVAQPLYQEMYEAVVLLLEIRMGLDVPYQNELAAPLIYQADVQPYYDILTKAEAIK